MDVANDAINEMNESGTSDRERHREWGKKTFENHREDRSFHEFEDEINEREKYSPSLQSDSSPNLSSSLEDTLGNFLKNGKLSLHTKHKKPSAAKFERMYFVCTQRFMHAFAYTNQHCIHKRCVYSIYTQNKILFLIYCLRFSVCSSAIYYLISVVQ